MSRSLAQLLCRRPLCLHTAQWAAHTHAPGRSNVVRQFTTQSARPFLSPSVPSILNTTAPHKTTPVPSTTLAITYHQTGSATDVLTITILPLPPSLRPNQLLLRFLAAPINPSDLNMVEGTYPLAPSQLPAVAGNEGVAVVEAVGEGVVGWSVGQWVTPVRPTLGTWRQWAVVEAHDVEAVPEGLTSQQAAVLSVNPCTAYRLLKDIVPLQPGAVVVQNAATSAVGQSVIQIARQLGLTTINLIRPRPTPQHTQATIDQLRSLGATHVVVEDDSLSAALTALPPATLALNGIGGSSSTALFRSLRGGGGTHVTYGGMSRRPVTVGAGQLIFGDVVVRGFWMSRWNEANEGSEERARMREEVGGWMREGKLRLDVEEVVVDEEGVEGIRHALQRNAEPFKMKKVLLTFPED